MLETSRRRFLGQAAALLVPARLAAVARAEEPGASGLPLVDYHAHVDAVPTLEELLAIAKRRGVRLGILEHAGRAGQHYPGLLSTDADLGRFLARLEGLPHYRGIQAEGLDWPECFSMEVVARLDYVLTDALTFPEKDGRKVELWQPGVTFEDPQDFMDRYVDFHGEVMARPIDILANPTFLPDALMDRFDALWTGKRMDRVVEAARANAVAIEINTRYRLPRRPFLDRARKAGLRFSFGTNIHGPGVGDLAYGLEMAKALGLSAADVFTPAPAGRKPIEVRRPA